MNTFWLVLSIIVGVIAVIALVILAVYPWMETDWPILGKLFTTTLVIVIIAGGVSYLIENPPSFTFDNSHHCGPGTHYVDKKYFNPATKTVMTEWMCVA